MQEIKCPKCGEVFQVDESGYHHIAKQVRDKEFKKELEQRIKELNENRDKEIEIQVLKVKEEKEKEITQQKETILKLENEAEWYAKELRDQEKELNTSNKEKYQQLQKERDEEYNKIVTEKDEEIAKRVKEIIELKAKLGASETEKKLAVAEALSEQQKAISDKDIEISLLKSDLEKKEKDNDLNERNLSEKYNAELKKKDDQIAYYKDLKMRQSTKMVGETLEQHCEILFNQIRMAAFPNAYFEKDNDAKHGSKGDYIFRESSEDGTEFISIMFEMKNEMDETATKHKNEDFFAKLDKDRKEKKCEYAVLVSLLEKDSDLYNDGIVDVSYKYEKMYVIRPQFFIPLISLLRNAARNSLKYRQELAIAQNQQLDVQRFQENMNDFKDKFSYNYNLASKKFKTAIDEIDKTIKNLEKTKEALLSSENNLRLANEKAEKLSIKRLTKDAPSVRALFEEIE